MHYCCIIAKPGPSLNKTSRGYKSGGNMDLEMIESWPDRNEKQRGCINPSKSIFFLRSSAEAQFVYTTNIFERRINGHK